ncbi:MAG: glucose 1-dehydrogenase [Deltaproteobacteria bacterium]|nr:glucose 1-dehydrogenase [Deltaproteobacteria bacterium]
MAERAPGKLALDGRVAIITGGASGIGARTARLFVENGARVVIGDMQEELGRAVAAELGGAALFQRTEVSREDDVRALVARAEQAFGRLDCIFNNAGFGGALGPIADTPVEEFDLTFAVLVRGVFLGMKHASPLIARQGGSVINTASVAALVAGYSPHAYAAAKAAVIQLSRSVALELAPKRVRVNCICPGFIATPLALNTVGRRQTDLSRAAESAGMASAQPIPRAGEPEDIAQMALFLASDASSFVTAQHFVVDGGISAGRAWPDQPEWLRAHRPLRVYRPS